MIRSYIVLRIEEAQDFRMGRIVDFISMDAAEEFTLFKLLEYCEEQNVDAVDFFFTGSFHMDSLNKLGFSSDEKEPHSLIPMYFNPIIKSKKHINFVFKLINNDHLDERLNDIDNWYITKGDGDQDRPN